MESNVNTDFLTAFDAFAQAVRRARGAPAANGGLTLSQYGLLEGLITRPVARVQELASRAGIAPSTATRILDALERRGVVERARSLDDRRAVAVSLTDIGQQLLHSQQDWLRGRQRAFYESLPASERELAPDLLLRLAALIDELATGCPPHEPEH
jgi:DNA-binding MarR family transcriptional regulator